MMRSIFMSPAVMSAQNSERRQRDFGLRLDIKKCEDGTLIEADVPGFDKEDISVTLEDGYLNIKAEKSEEKTVEKEGYVRRERCCGSFSRSICVGDDVTEEDVSASLDKGVLSVKIAKKPEEKSEAKKIDIKQKEEL